jgi:hypothetical protein
MKINPLKARMNANFNRTDAEGAKGRRGPTGSEQWQKDGDKKIKG